MQTIKTEHISLNKEEYAIYACVCYFDVFNHPLKACEIRNFCQMQLDELNFTRYLKSLIDQKILIEQEGYFFLKEGNKDWIAKRLAAEKGFKDKEQIIRRYAGLVSKFPFVESVAISGSCSKGLLDKDGDVDYFIITAPNRLWLCRTLLIAFKKIFLLNSKKYFCVNYFLSADNLEIPDRNLFVAFEISTLIPVSNKQLFEDYLSKNSWIKNYLPNKPSYNSSFLSGSKPGKYFSAFVEWLLGGRVGDYLDKVFFRYTLSTWEKKFPDFNEAEFDLNLRSRKNVSKHHPRGFQKKVLHAFESRLGQIQSSA